MSTAKILIIPGSQRTGSLNVRLAGAIHRAFVQADVDVTRISLVDFPLPIYDGDLEAKSGIPANAIDLKRMVGSHHGIVFVTPEYNSSLPPLVKNAVDWISRVVDRGETPGQVFRTRAFALASASGGKLGGARCLAAFRLILAGCRAPVIANQLTLSFADDAYDDSDHLKHPADRDALDALVKQLVETAQHMM